MLGKIYLPSPAVSLTVSVVVFGIIFGVSPKVDYFQNQFFERDAALSYYDTNGDQVSNNELRLITFVISVITVFLYATLSTKGGLKLKNLHPKIHFRLYLFFYFGLGLAAVVLATECVTTILKKTVGSPRPSAFYLCNYKGYADAVNSGNFTAYNSLTTVNAKGYVSNCYGGYDDAWSSFPSGHASLSFSTMLYSTLLIRKLFNLERLDFMTLGNFLAFSPIVVAAWICVTRLTDNKHHVQDVIGGALIGSVTAVLVYQTVLEFVYGKVTNEEEDEGILGTHGEGSEGGVEVAHKKTLEEALLR